MKTNIVDDLGDEYFLDSYKGGLYQHNGKPYRFEGFVKASNPEVIVNRRQESESNGFKKEHFNNDKGLLEKWIQEQEETLENLLNDEPQEYETCEDDDGEEITTDDVTEEWEDWNRDVRCVRHDIANGKKLLKGWDGEEDSRDEKYFLYFTNLATTNKQPLLLPVEEFTSLSGFHIPTGYMNVLGQVWVISYTRCYRIRDVTPNERLANMFNQSYPSLKEALEMMNRNENLVEIAISPNVQLTVDNRYDTDNESSRIAYKSWSLRNTNGELLAHWDSKSRTVWAKNKNILSLLSKKG